MGKTKHSGAKAVEDRAVLPFRSVERDQSSRFSMEAVMKAYSVSLQSILMNAGSPESQLERRFAEYLGVAHCIAVPQVNVCFSLLLDVLDATGEVLLSPFGSTLPSASVAAAGLTPIFCDCSLDTWNVSPSDVARRISSRTSVLIATHFAGNPCDLDSLCLIADRAGINLVFDATEALGATFRGSSIAGAGDASVISLPLLSSFQKEAAGLICTNQAPLALRLKEALRRFEREALGADLFWTPPVAAASIAGLSLLEARVLYNRRLAHIYDRLLAYTPGITGQVAVPFSSGTYNQYILSVAGAEEQSGARELCALLNAIEEDGQVRSVSPLYSQVAGKGGQNEFNLPIVNAEGLGRSLISLPTGESVDTQAAERVAVNISNTLNRVNGI